MIPKFLEQAPHGKMSLAEATAARDEKINRILKSGLKSGLITQSEFDEHQALAQSLIDTDHPEIAHKRMVEILEKSHGGAGV